MAGNEYYSTQGQPLQTLHQHPAPGEPYYEPPKSPWERPQNLDHAPQPVYQGPGQDQYQGQGQPKGYYTAQQPQQGVPVYGGQGQPHIVVVKERHSTEDAALGFCAGCATACCCCGCTVM